MYTHLQLKGTIQKTKQTEAFFPPNITTSGEPAIITPKIRRVTVWVRDELKLKLVFASKSINM